MTTQTIYFRGSRDDVRKLLRQVPRALAGKDGDPTGAVRDLQLAAGMTALSLIKDAFVQKARGGTDAAGDSWAPLADSTKRKKRRRGNPEILRDTGVLLNSLSPGVSVPGQVLEVHPGEVIVGTNVPYAPFIHLGTPRMPARPLWPSPEKWPSEWWSLILRKVQEGTLRLLMRLFNH